MSDRFLTSLCALFMVIAVLAQVPVSGQARPAGADAKTTAAKPWTPPRTPDGQPDLQGIWLNNSATPLERPKALAGRQLLTDEEVVELKKRAARLFGANTDSDFAGGDNLFLAALANLERYKNPNSTGTSFEMVEREFDSRTSLIVDPPDGRIPPLTPEAQERNAKAPTPTGAGQGPAAGPEDLSNALRCITYGVPRLGASNISSAGPLGYYQILQTPGYVVFFLEAIHEARIIPIGGRPHLRESIRQWNGDSRGRWDGNTLVVDTTNFSRTSNLLGSGEHLLLVERFTRVAPDTINYEITLNDQSTWTRPWTAVIHLRQTQNRIYEYACHEGNHRTMTGILAGARSAEAIEKR